MLIFSEIDKKSVILKNIDNSASMEDIEEFFRTKRVDIVEVFRTKRGDIEEV